jgi:hypothetical protein
MSTLAAELIYSTLDVMVSRPDLARGTVASYSKLSLSDQLRPAIALTAPLREDSLFPSQNYGHSAVPLDILYSTAHCWFYTSDSLIAQGHVSIRPGRNVALSSFLTVGHPGPRPKQKRQEKKQGAGNPGCGETLVRIN